MLAPRRCAYALGLLVYVAQPLVSTATLMQQNSAESFWALLDELVNQKPFNKRSLESILGIPLRRVDKNKFFEFYESEAAVVRGVSIQRAELRARKNAANSGLLLLDIKEPCVVQGDLRKHHAGALSVTPPSGNSPDERIYYTADHPWGSVSFGFAQQAPNCLVSLVLDATGSPTG